MCPSVCMCPMCVQKRFPIPWNWSYLSYRQSWVFTWCWEPNRGPLQEQESLLSTELSLQPPIHSFIHSKTGFHIAQAGLNPFTSTSWVLGLQLCTKTPGFVQHYFNSTFWKIKWLVPINEAQMSEVTGSLCRQALHAWEGIPCSLTVRSSPLPWPGTTHF